MTAITTAPPPPSTGRRGPVILWTTILVLLLAVAVFIATRPTSNSIAFDPDNPSPGGGQAMARVLADQGVQVDPMHRLSDLLAEPANPQTTVLISDPQELDSAAMQRVLKHFSTAYRIVLLAPGSDALDGKVTPGAWGTGNCTIDWLSGLRVQERVGDRAYGPTQPDQGVCLGGDRGYGAVLVDDHILVLGATGAIANDSVLNADNAAIGLRTLGGSQRLLWLSADLDAVQEGQGEDGLPWPRWFAPALLILGAGVVTLMLWRGRRLGRLVTEPLPVIVPAQETTTARGRLYRKAKDTDRAARVLRAATRTRISAYLGSPDPVRAAADHTGRPELEISALLLDGPVGSERELVSLANELSTLERQVRPQ